MIFLGDYPMKGTIVKLIVLLGIFVGATFYFVAPTLGDNLRYNTELDVKGVAITEESNNTIRQAYNYSFSLAKNEKVVIEFGVHYLNSTVSMIILGQGQYDSYIAANQTSAGLTGQPFYVSTPNLFLDPGSSASNGGDVITSSTITNDGYIYCEFMGDGSTGSDVIWSEPGNYKIVIFGRNPSHNVEDVNVQFDLKVRKTGSGEIVESVFSSLGMIFIIGSGILALVFLIKNPDGGN